jgi:hypothetical protein
MARENTHTQAPFHVITNANCENANNATKRKSIMSCHHRQIAKTPRHSSLRKPNIKYRDPPQIPNNNHNATAKCENAPRHNHKRNAKTHHATITNEMQNHNDMQKLNESNIQTEPRRNKETLNTTDPPHHNHKRHAKQHHATITNKVLDHKDMQKQTNEPNNHTEPRLIRFFLFFAFLRFT